MTNIGPVFDTWSATNVSGLYPSNGLTAQILWTNMLKEFDCGDWTVPADGNYEIRFTVVDKHVSSSGYSLSFDHLQLSSIAPSPRLAANAVNGNLILSWPATAAEYSLQYTDALPASSWYPALPPPVVVGSELVVTNPMTSNAAFYRLHKP